MRGLAPSPHSEGRHLGNGCSMAGDTRRSRTGHETSWNNTFALSPELLTSRVLSASKGATWSCRNTWAPLSSTFSSLSAGDSTTDR